MLTNWKTFKLIELYDISSGLSKSADEFGFGFPFLSFSTVFKNYFIPEELDQLVNTSKKERVTCSIKKGDVFLTRTSEVIEELGMSCVALKDYPNATFNGFTKRLRPKNDEVVNPQFMGYYLRNKQFRAELSAYSTLTTRASLNNGIIEKLKVTLPPLPIQQKIASILSSYDELIENNKQRIKLLEEMAEEIYKEWFVRLRFPGYENTKIVDGLPEGWENTKIENILKTSSGGTPSRLKESEYYGGDIDWIKTGELKDTFILNAQETITEIGLKNSSAKLFPPNTLLMAMYGVNIGQLGISVKASAANQAVCVFRPITDVKFSLYYTFYFFKSIRLHLFNISMGAAQQNLSQDLIKKIDILKPKTEIISKYDLIIEPIFEEIKALLQKNQLLQETRDLLLPRLISGKLSVEHLLEEEALGMVAEPRGEYKKTNSIE